MDVILTAVFKMGIPILIILVALIAGSTIEKRHYRSIDKRERSSSRVALLNGKGYPKDQSIAEARLVSGAVVISYDHFKRFLAGLRMLFGGEVKSYVSLVDRGRREAILRMKEQCADADLIVNLRIETSSVSKGAKRRSIGAVEVFAYGTALWYAHRGD